MPEAVNPTAPASSDRGPAAAAAPPTPASDENVAADIDSACPICLVNEDDHGKFALCCACGRLYCGDCNVAERMGRVENCPTCRAPFAVSAEVKVEWLLRLLARSPGRHTPVAQFNLGVMYQDGTGIPQDFTEAAQCYRLAADQGLAVGQCNLGLMYEQGTGVPQDHAEAALWYGLAADQGSAGGQFNLGVMYQDGTGVPQDYAEAAQLFRLAADQEDARGQSSLGVMYEDGTGVRQDQSKAARYYRLAAEQGLATGQYNLGLMYQNGAGVSKDLAEAAQWHRIAADQGLAAAQLNLGVTLFTGNGVLQDFTEATRLFTLACEQGFQPAEDLLGKLTAEFPAGTRVRIVGLVAAAHLNGRLGTATQPTKPLVAGRIAVRIDGQTKITPVSWVNSIRLGDAVNP